MFAAVGNAEKEAVCPVFGSSATENDKIVILQSPSVGGTFSTLELKSTLFLLRQIVHMCRPTGSLIGDTCDLLIIECVQDPDRRGSFLVNYVSLSGEKTDVTISYGKRI